MRSGGIGVAEEKGIRPSSQSAGIKADNSPHRQGGDQGVLLHTIDLMEGERGNNGCRQWEQAACCHHR